MHALPDNVIYNYSIADNDYGFIFQKFGVNDMSISLCCDMAMQKIERSIDYITAKNRLESISVGFQSFLLNIHSGKHGESNGCILFPSMQVEMEVREDIKRHSCLA